MRSCRYGTGDGLAVGVVEEAEGLAAEGGGTATVVVGEEVVAGGCWDHFHRRGLSPGYFRAQGWRESVGFGRFRVKCEGPACAGLWVDLGLLLL